MSLWKLLLPGPGWLWYILDKIKGDEEEEHEVDKPYWAEDPGRSSREYRDAARQGVREGARKSLPAILFLDLEKAFYRLGHFVGSNFVKILMVLVVLAILIVVVLPFIVGSTSIDEWLGYGGEQAQNTALGASDDFGGLYDAYREQKARVTCVLSGPACFRQWRLNNTKRPDSQDVGEDYGLKIENFQVGQGSSVDIAYKKPSYRLPVSFTLSNNRHGLKGINALNVSYRIKVIDFDRRGDNAYCNTGWYPVDGFNIRQDASGDFSGNDLYPGTSASTGFLIRDELNLGNCELLQPGAGDSRQVTVEVRYDYFSQATLYFDAMSRQYLQQNIDITPSWTNSLTADTPVKSAVNVYAPVLYDEERVGQGEEASQSFGVKATLNTDDFDVSYRVKEIEVTKSGQTEITDDENQCQFVPGGSENRLMLSEQAKQQITGGQGGRWFDRNNPPPIFGCTMRLSNPGSISPSGETLTMGIASNYTVKLDDELEGFRAYNSRCADFNCPLLVSQQAAAEREAELGYKLKYTCEGVDSGNGCSIVKPDLENWDQPTLINRKPNQGSTDVLDSKIEPGEIAVDPARMELSLTPSYRSDYGGDDDSWAFGLPERDWNTLQSRTGSGGYALVSQLEADGERDVDFYEVGEACSHWDLTEQITEWKNSENRVGDDDLVIAFKPGGLFECNIQAEECEDSQGRYVEVFGFGWCVN